MAQELIRLNTARWDARHKQLTEGGGSGGGAGGAPADAASEAHEAAQARIMEALLALRPIGLLSGLQPLDEEKPDAFNAGGAPEPVRTTGQAPAGGVLARVGEQTNQEAQ